MQILLINPWVDQEAVYGKKFKSLGAVLPPLGLCYLAGVLQKANLKVNIIDANLLSKPYEGIREQIKKLQPEVIGIYATTLGIEAAEDLAKGIKQDFPKIFTVIGGPHITGYGKETLRCKFFDFGIIGEGEFIFLQLVQTLENNGNEFKDIPGLVWRKQSEIFQNTPVVLAKDIDEIPFPARNLLPPLNKYHAKKMLFMKEPVAHIFTSRGCPYSCIFCQTPFGKKVRFHSAAYVAEEITQLVKDYGVNEIRINDDTFNLDEERVAEIFRILKQKGIYLTWSCNLRVNSVKDKSFLKRIKNDGCWLISIGLESGDSKVLQALKKGITLEQGRQVCAWAREVGLKVQASFMIGNISETEETILKTIEFAKSLPIHYPTFSLLTPFPGTELWEKVADYGQLNYTRFSDLTLSHKPTFIPNGLTMEQLTFFHRKAYFDAYIRLEMVIRHLRGVDSLAELKKLWLADFPFCP